MIRFIVPIFVFGTAVMVATILVVVAHFGLGIARSTIRTDALAGSHLSRFSKVLPAKEIPTKMMHRKRPRDFSQSATLDFKRDHSNSKGASTRLP